MFLSLVGFFSTSESVPQSTINGNTSREGTPAEILYITLYSSNRSSAVLDSSDECAKAFMEEREIEGACMYRHWVFHIQQFSSIYEFCFN